MPEEIKSKEKRTFVLVAPDGTESGTFHGNPRQAALKVVNTLGGTKDKPVEFKIRERGTKKLHVYSGYKEKVKAPEKRPEWMPEMVNKTFVTKLRTEKPEKKPKE